MSFQSCGRGTVHDLGSGVRASPRCHAGLSDAAKKRAQPSDGGERGPRTEDEIEGGSNAKAHADVAIVLVVEEGDPVLHILGPEVGGALPGEKRGDWRHDTNADG